MALLTGPEIARQVGLGGVTIDPFDPARLGPNSYDLTLAPELLVYGKNYPRHLAHEVSAACRQDPGKMIRYAGAVPLDMAAEEPTVALTIPPTGLVLWPGVLYLGATAERAGADDFVPRIDGRSSAGRLGLSVHITAGLGDVGFKDRWTLEITVVVPLRVYAGARICQVTFETVAGEPRPYRGQYAGQTGPRPSGLWRDFAAGPIPAAEPPPGCPGCAALRAVALQCADRLADCSEILGRLAERKDRRPT